LLTRLILRGIL